MVPKWLQACLGIPVYERAEPEKVRAGLEVVRNIVLTARRKPDEQRDLVEALREAPPKRNVFEDGPQVMFDTPDLRPDKSTPPADSGGRSRRASESDLRRAIDEVTGTVEQGVAFADRLRRLVNERLGGDSAACYKRAGVSRQVYSKIISCPEKGVSKGTVLQLCVGLMLKYAEAEELLGTAGFSFSMTSYEDMAFAWCLENGVHNIFDVNKILYGCGCDPVDVK